MKIVLKTLEDVEKALAMSDYSIRVNVLKALISSPETAQAFTDGDGGTVVDTLMRVIDDRNKNFRRHVIRALGILGNGESERLLLSRLDDPAESLRPEIVSALGRLLPPDRKSLLAPYLSERDYRVVQCTADAMRHNLPDDKDLAVQVLLCSSRVQDWDRLREMGEQAIAPLWRCLDSDLEVIHKLAIHALSMFDAPALSLVTEAFSDGTVRQKSGFLKCLTEKVGREVSAVLCAAMEDSSPTVNRLALSLLSSVSAHVFSAQVQKEILHLVQRLSKAADEDVRMAAIRALGLFHGPDIVSCLKGAVATEERPGPLAMAILLFGEQGDEDHAFFVRFLGHPDWRVRESATRSILASSGGQAYLEELILHDGAPLPARVSAFRAMEP